jgi:TM2 domain-containing membrane protein YozV
MSEKKNKWIAFLLALVFGFLGFHRFYLGQKGLGILYIALVLTGISFFLGFIDAVVFLFMSYDKFNRKYNKQWYDKGYEHPRRYPLRSKRKNQRRQPSKIQALKQLKKKGTLHFKGFELEEAEAAFKKALEKAPNDLTLHFNLACTLSRLEEIESAWLHLRSAVELGFDDMEKIDHHPALAYLRVQDDWIEKRNQLREAHATGAKEKSPALFIQLSALSKARDQGILSTEEFRRKKDRLLQQSAPSDSDTKNSRRD